VGTAISTGVSFFAIFLWGRWGGMVLREQSPLGLPPLLGTWLRGLYLGPFYGALFFYLKKFRQ
jgi:hypothetical protein